LKPFFWLRGAQNEEYHFPLCPTKQKLDQVLLNIGYKEKSGTYGHMVTKKWTFHDICLKPTTNTKCNSAERNGLRRVMHQMSELPVTFGNVAPAPTSITQAEVHILSQSQEVHILIQSQAVGTKNTTKMGTCHNFCL
jgi:hypothetical protein